MIQWIRNFINPKLVYEEIVENTTDMHSHLIPGIDDGAKSMAESIEMIRMFQEYGFKKLITTPHVMSDAYPNNSEKIHTTFLQLKDEAKRNNLTVTLETAAEYYIDEVFNKNIGKETLLTFGKSNFILVETSMYQNTNIFEITLKKLIQNGYCPVLAHPERYPYFHNSFESYVKIKNMGVLFQLNILSISGHYSFPTKKIAEKLIENRMIDFAGSDVHTKKNLEKLKLCMGLPYYKKLMQLPLLNNTL